MLVSLNPAWHFTLVAEAVHIKVVRRAPIASLNCMVSVGKSIGTVF
jgi:hypothetical protein